VRIRLGRARERKRSLRVEVRLGRVYGRKEKALRVEVRLGRVRKEALVQVVVLIKKQEGS
jgi:ribosomal protein L21E